MSRAGMDFNQIRNSPSTIYYDAIFRNFNSEEFESNIPLRFIESRDAPILNKASDYMLSIVRFKVDTFSLPIFIPDIKRDQADPNLTIYTVTLEYNDGVNPVTITAPFPITYVPDDKSQSVPQPPSSNPYGLQSDTLYYYTYSYESFIRMINTSLNDAMTNLKATVGAPLVGVESPFMCWNPSTKSAEIYCRLSHFDESITPALLTPKVSIYFNRPLFSYFNSFPHDKYSDSNSNNRHYRIVCDSCNKIRAGTYDGGVDLLIKVSQEYETSSIWSPVGSVCFTTNTMPIVANQLSQPLIFDNGSQVQLSNTYNNFSNIITDIQSVQDGYRSTLIYYPPGENRYIDLTNDQPLSQVDIQLIWIDKAGRKRDIFLPPNSSCSIKLLFKRKY